jgi:hypothetical protein
MSAKVRWVIVIILTLLLLLISASQAIAPAGGMQLG